MTGNDSGHVAHVLHEQQLAQVLEQVVDDTAEILSLLRELLEEEERSGRVAIDDHVAQPQQRLLVDRADELEDGLRIDRVVRRRGELVERRDRVAKRAAGGPCDERESRILCLDALALCDAAQECHDLGQSRTLEDERLAARAHGGDHADEIRRAEHEQQVWWRLLDQLEQRVPRLARQLVRLVDDVDLVAALDGLEHDPFPELADVVDSALRRGVHLDHVERGAVRDREADRAGLVRGRRRAGRPGAVQGLREDPRHGGLARSARASKEIGLAHLIVLDRVLQRADDRLLPDDLVEALRAVLPVKGRHLVDSIRWGQCPATRSAFEIGITGGTCVACSDRAEPRHLRGSP